MPSDVASTDRRRARRPRRRRRLPSSSSSSPALSPSRRPIALAGTLDDDRPHGPYLIGAWTFGDRPSLEAAVKAGAIDEVSVDWLQSRADGSVAARVDTGFIAEAKRKDCRVFATLTDYDESQHTFDPAISAAILATAESRRRHADAVAAWCKTNDVAGVDVDWEAVKGSRRDEYSAFVEELARRLHARRPPHRRRRLPQEQGARRLGRARGQDWARLGRAVDQFRVMTYNYSGSWSGPGPLSPPEWMDRVITFAET